MSLGGHTRFPLRMGGGKSRARNIYAALIAGQGTAYSQHLSAIVNQENMATAHAIARAQANQEQSANQSFVERANILLSEWERIYGVTPNENESDASRRNTLASIENSKFNSSKSTIETALSVVVGDQVTVRSTVASDHNRSKITFGAPDSLSATVVANGGRYVAGTHIVEIVQYNAAGSVHLTKLRASLALSDGDAVYVPFHRHATYPKSLVCVSPRAGESTTQMLIANHDGSPVVITEYPSNKAYGGPIHYWVIVSDAVINNKQTVAKIHKILGPALPADCTYTVVATDSPFLLDTAYPPGSPLGIGAL